MALINSLKEVPSLISKSVIITGDIKNASNIEIEGKVEGNIFADTITLREGGEIIGNTKSKIFNIKGNFKGNSVAEKINISDTAIVNGLLEYNFLSVDYGANINCELKRINEKNNKSISLNNLINLKQEIEKKDNKNDDEKDINKDKCENK